MSEHIHDCTGPDMRCACGFVFTVPRFSVSFDFYDNKTHKSLSDGFSCDAASRAAEALREAATKIEQMAYEAVSHA